MIKPVKTPSSKLGDEHWFSREENHGRTFRLRRLFTMERVGEAVSADRYGRVPSHALVMRSPCRRYTLYCNDGSDGALFDALLISRDYRNTDLVYAALWGRTVYFQKN